MVLVYFFPLRKPFGISAEFSTFIHFRFATTLGFNGFRFLKRGFRFRQLCLNTEKVCAKDELPKQKCYPSDGFGRYLTK